MRKIPQSLKLFIVLILGTAYVFSFSHLCVQAYGVFHVSHTVSSASTSDASKSIAGETKNGELKPVNTKILESASPILLNEVKIKPANIPDDLLIAIGELKSIEVKGQSTFSLLEYIDQKQIQHFSSSSLSIIASGIYQTILPTNFNILERNTSQTVPVFTSPGFEAKVDFQKNNDFVFVNPNKTSYQIELKWLSDGMHVTLYGQRFASTYKIDGEHIQYFPPKTIVQYSPIVNPGQIKVQVIGQKGLLAKVYRKEYQNGLLVHNDLISDDFYPPVPRVEIHPLVENSNSSDMAQPNQVSDGESANSTTSNVTSNRQSTNQVNSGEAVSQNASNNSSISQSSVSSEK